MVYTEYFLLGYPQYLKPSYGGIIGEMLSEIPLAKSLLPLAMDSKTPSSAKVEEIIVNLISMKLGSSYHLWKGTAVKQQLHDSLQGVGEQTAGY